MPQPNDVRRGKPFPHPKDPQEALSLLIEGNLRHQAGQLELRDHSAVGDERASRQMPFAAIISCADSRVSPTLIFDVDRGNIFSSKVAGNIIDTGTLGSTEFAIKVLGVKVVMVLGHSDCGAVKTAIEVANGTESYPPEEYGAIGEVVDAIVPPIRELPASERTVPTCVSVNARAQAAEIASRPPIVKQAVEAGQIAVLPAVYEIETGIVSLI